MSKTTNWLMEVEESMLSDFSPMSHDQIRDIPLVLDAEHLTFNMIPEDAEQCFEIEINNPMYQRMLIPFNYTEINLLIKKLSELRDLMGPADEED
jgi:hypothetical protein